MACARAEHATQNRILKCRSAVFTNDKVITDVQGAWAITCSVIHIFIHFLPRVLFWVKGQLEPIPFDFGGEEGEKPCGSMIWFERKSQFCGLTETLLFSPNEPAFFDNVSNAMFRRDEHCLVLIPLIELSRSCYALHFCFSSRALICKKLLSQSGFFFFSPMASAAFSSCLVKL